MKRGKGIIYILITFTFGCTQNKPITNDYLIIKGANSHYENKISEAIKYYNDAYKLDKKNKIVLEELGYLNYQLKKYNIAIKYYSEILQIDSNNKLALKNLGIIYYEIGDYSKSQYYLEKIINKDFHNYKILGITYYKLGNKDKASYNLQEAFLNMEDYDEEYFQILTKVLLDKKNKEGLYYFLKKGYNKYLVNKEYNIFYSKILYENLENYDEAEIILKKYLLEQKIDDHILITLSRVYIGKKDYNKAKIVLNLISDKSLRDYKILKSELEGFI
ncbi:tetratricopeptide repeat protein [Cetobacterium sp. SF1]|uniref:tetratricopeptide repeat protein n=1 Tax=Cetobacterium sp. SF1 TaxID=3417654 RepID=UPI003CF2FD38